ISLLCQKKDSYTDSVYSKDTLGTILTTLQKFFFSVHFHLLISPFTESISLCLYKHLLSLTCLEARENVLLLRLLPVVDTGPFIASLYLPYSLRVGYSSALV